jgi:hypothetical protein
MITPAIFLTANGSLIISTSNRMARIIDRIRVLNDRADELCRGVTDCDFIPERIDHIQEQLRSLIWRGDCIRYALVMLYVAFGGFVGTSLGLALDVLLNNRVPFLPTALAMVGVTLLLGACVNLVREALEALRGNREEVRFYDQLHKRRLNQESGCGESHRNI